MDVYVITDDPCLEQYEFSLYKEKGKGAAAGSVMSVIMMMMMRT
jgi:hypothetical protein